MNSTTKRARPGFFAGLTEREPARRSLRASMLLVCCAAGASLLATAFADGDRDGGSDPTVGTLPMLGGESEGLDQTLTIRGPIGAIRAAIADASGEGAFEVIDVGQGNAWMRFYGDVRVEFGLSELVDLDVAVFAGFEGGGMRYRVTSREGAGSARNLASGDELTLDPIRFANTGLIDEPLAVEALHRTGERTRTVLELRPSEGTIVITQDV